MSITRLTGIVIESQKRYQGYGGGITPTLHQEFWLRTPDGKEVHVHLVDDEVPIRKGHKLEVFFQGGHPVGLINFTTDQYANLQAVYHVMPDHPEYSDFELSLLRPSRLLVVFVLAGCVFGIVNGIWEGFGLLPIVAGVIGYATWEGWRHRQKPDKVIHNDNYGVVESAIQAALVEHRQRNAA